jgi:hypothetical protein
LVRFLVIPVVVGGTNALADVVDGARRAYPLVKNDVGLVVGNEGYSNELFVDGL